MSKRGRRKKKEESPKEEPKEVEVGMPQEQIVVDEDIENLKDIIIKIANNIPDEDMKNKYVEKLNKFINDYPTKEARDELARKSLEYFINLASRGEKYKKIATAKFLNWFARPDGQIIVAYIMKPKFRARVLHVIGQAILTASRLKK